MNILCSFISFYVERSKAIHICRPTSRHEHAKTPSGLFRNLKGRSPGGISSVHFQKCSKFSIILTLNISTIFSLPHGGLGARASPKYAPENTQRLWLINFSGSGYMWCDQLSDVTQA